MGSGSGRHRSARYFSHHGKNQTVRQGGRVAGPLLFFMGPNAFPHPPALGGRALLSDMAFVSPAGLLGHKQTALLAAIVGRAADTLLLPWGAVEGRGGGTTTKLAASGLDGGERSIAEVPPGPPCDALGDGLHFIEGQRYWEGVEPLRLADDGPEPLVCGRVIPLVLAHPLIGPGSKFVEQRAVAAEPQRLALWSVFLQIDVLGQFPKVVEVLHPKRPPGIVKRVLGDKARVAGVSAELHEKGSLDRRREANWGVSRGITHPDRGRQAIEQVCVPVVRVTYSQRGRRQVGLLPRESSAGVVKVKDQPGGLKRRIRLKVPVLQGRGSWADDQTMGKVVGTVWPAWKPGLKDCGCIHRGLRPGSALLQICPCAAKSPMVVLMRRPGLSWLGGK